MPSGSHRGSRGSHSSGGSRSSSSFGGSRGGSHRSSFSSSSSRRSSYGGGYYSGPHHHRPFRVRWGGRYYVYSDGATVGIAVLVFAIIFAFIFMRVGAIDVNYYKQELTKIEEDYDYYQDMIQYAENNRDRGYIVEGEVVDKFYNEDAGKYYIVYKVDVPDSMFDLQGYTYSVYTLEETSNFRRGESIEIAVDTVPVTSQTDSINVDYKNTTLEDDGEYVITKNNLTKARLQKWISVVVFIGLIVLLVYITWKKKKPEESSEKKEEAKVESTTYKCAYCGSTYSKTRAKCPSCGASLRK